jgi:nicotinamidase-related amidase
VNDALLLVDVINDFRHEDGEKLLAAFRERHAALVAAIDGTRSKVAFTYLEEVVGARLETAT